MPDDGDMVLYIDQNTGKVTFEPQTGYGFGEIESSICLEEGDTKLGGPWYHLAVVVDSATGESRMYIDGSLAGMGVIPDEPEVDIELTLNGFCVGGPFFAQTQCNFQGMMDAFAISNEALSPEQFVLPVPEPTTVLML